MMVVDSGVHWHFLLLEVITIRVSDSSKFSDSGLSAVVSAQPLNTERYYLIRNDWFNRSSDGVGGCNQLQLPEMWVTGILAGTIDDGKSAVP